MWTKVTDRLPESNSFVFVIGEDGYITHDFYNTSAEDYLNDGWEASPGNPVVYWMYLQNPLELDGLNMLDSFKNYWGLAEDWKGYGREKESPEENSARAEKWIANHLARQ